MMRLFNFMIPESLDRRLQAEHRRSGVPMSEIARRAIDRYLCSLGNPDSGTKEENQCSKKSSSRN